MSFFSFLVYKIGEQESGTVTALWGGGGISRREEMMGK
jgi:hypothetical protein